MPNHCYCGRSTIQPYCDGSHARLAAPEPPKAVPPAPASEPVAAPAPSPRAGLLKRLFGRKRAGA